jgi:protein arginine kinase activator
VHLCEDCAKEIGLNSKLSNFSLAVPDFLSFLNEEGRDSDEYDFDGVCKNCGRDLSQIQRKHNLGCPMCYHFFSADLEKMVHTGSVQSHKGRVPVNYRDIDASFEQNQSKSVRENKSSEADVNLLKDQLSEAVDNEEYEQAAVLRDKIRDLEKICQE